MVNILKEIGETLKEARENIGLSIEEAASDLKLRPSQIENIEAGNKDFFEEYFSYEALGRELSFEYTYTSDGAIDLF